MKIKQKAFSLVEILTAAAIFTLIIAGIFAIFNIAGISWRSSMGLLDIQQNARLAMDGMTRELRQLKREPGRGITVSANGISFYIPGTTDPIRYHLQDNQIIREHPLNTTQILANNITALSFCCWAGACAADCSTSAVLQVSMQASKLIHGRLVSLPLIEKVRLRNEQ